MKNLFFSYNLNKNFWKFSQHILSGVSFNLPVKVMDFTELLKYRESFFRRLSFKFYSSRILKKLPCRLKIIVKKIITLSDFLVVEMKRKIVFVKRKTTAHLSDLKTRKKLIALHNSPKIALCDTLITAKSVKI